MSEFAQRQNSSQNRHSLSTEQSDHAKAQHGPARNPFCTQPPIWGNQAFQRLLRARAIQAKLMVNEHADKYEQEADRVAEQVLRMPEPDMHRKPGCPLKNSPSCRDKEDKNEIIQTKALAQSGFSELQRRSVEEEELLQTKPFALRQGELKGEKEELCQTKPLLQRLVNDGIGIPFETPAIVLDVMRSPGRPLEPATRAFMEPRFGHDFNHVRIHNDAQAAKSARAVNARAFTVGRDVAFGTGEYAPDKAAGRRLLAHELTHTIQQGSSAISPKLQTKKDEGENAASKVKKMLAWPVTRKAAVNAYEYLEGLRDELREEVYAVAAVDDKLSKRLSKMQEMLPSGMLESQEFGYTQGLAEEALQEDSPMYQDLVSEVTWQDPERLDLVLSIYTQAGFGGEIWPAVNEKRQSTENSEIATVCDENGFLTTGFVSTDDIFNKEEQRAKGSAFGGSLKKGIIANFFGLNSEATIYGFSLPIFQKTKIGQIGGVSFTQPELDDVRSKPDKSQFDEQIFDIDKFVQTSGTVSFHFSRNNGKFLINAHQIKVDSMNYLFGPELEMDECSVEEVKKPSKERTVRVEESAFDKVKGKFLWAGERETEGSESVLEIKKLELTNLRSVEEEETYGIGAIVISGIKVLLNQPLGEAAELKTFMLAIDRSMYYLMDAFMVMSYGTMIGLGRGVKGIGKGVEEALKTSIQAFNTSFDFQLHFDELEIRNLIITSMGFIDRIELGESDIAISYAKLADYYRMEAERLKAMLETSSQELSKADQTNIKRYEDLAASEEAKYARYEEIRAALANQDKGEKCEMQELQNELEQLQSDLALRLSLLTDEMDIDTDEARAVGEMFDLESLESGGLAVETTIKPGGTLMIHFDAELSGGGKLSKFRVVSESGISIEGTVPDEMISFDNANLVGTVEFNEESGNTEVIALNSITVNNLVIQGLKLSSVSESLSLNLPPGFAVMKSLSVHDLLIWIPQGKGSSVKVMGAYGTDGTFSEEASATIVGLTHGLSKEGTGEQLSPIIRLLFENLEGVVGVQADEISFTPEKGGKIEFDLINPELLLSGKPGAIGLDTATTEEEDAKMASWQFGSAELEQFASISFAEFSMLIDPEDSEGIRIVVKDPAIEDLAMSFLFKEGEFRNTSHVEWISKQIYEMDGTFTGQLKGNLVAVKDEDQSTWMLSTQLEGEGEGKLEGEGEGKAAELNIASAEITLKPFIGENKTRRREKSEEDMKKLDFSSIDDISGKVNISVFGIKIPITILEGGFADMIPAMNQAHDLIMAQLDASPIMENIHVFEDVLGGYLTGETESSTTAMALRWMYTSKKIREMLKAPVNDMHKMTYSSRVADSMYQLLILIDGEEYTSIDLAQANKNTLDKSGNLVRLSAILDYQMNTSKSTKKGKGFAEAYAKAFMNSVEKTFKKRLPGDWVESAKSYESLSEEQMTEIVNEIWEGYSPFGAIFNISGLTDHIVGKLLPHVILGSLKIMMNAGLNIEISGKMNLGGSAASASDINITLSDNLTPEIKVSDLEIPAFETKVGQGSFGVRGISVREGAFLVDHYSKETQRKDEPLTEFYEQSYILKINQGSILGLRAEIPISGKTETESE